MPIGHLIQGIETSLQIANVLVIMQSNYGMPTLCVKITANLCSFEELHNYSYFPLQEKLFPVLHSCGQHLL